jgi:hypothetical protein
MTITVSWGTFYNQRVMPDPSSILLNVSSSTSLLKRAKRIKAISAFFNSRDLSQDYSPLCVRALQRRSWLSDGVY